MALAGNYEDLIKDIMRRTEDQRSLAQSRGEGAAQRRGVVGSDIESALVRAQTEPVVQGGQSQIAGILANIAEQGEARKYQTGERIAGQEYGTAERLGRQQYGTSERLGRNRQSEAIRNWQTGERESGQQFASAMAGYTDPNTGAWIPTTQKLGRGVHGSGYGQQLWGARGDAERGREHEFGMAQYRPTQKRKKWYEDAVGPAAQGLTTAGGYALFKH